MSFDTNAHNGTHGGNNASNPMLVSATLIYYSLTYLLKFPQETSSTAGYNTNIH